jgi:hypothetical protein
VLIGPPICGAMAQLVARLVRNEKVRGSSPLSSTKKFMVRNTDIVDAAKRLILAALLFLINCGRQRLRRAVLLQGSEDWRTPHCSTYSSMSGAGGYRLQAILRIHRHESAILALP